MTRHLDPVETAPANVAFLDALAFSVVPPDEKSYTWVLQEMQQFLAIETLSTGTASSDFAIQHIGDGVAVIAWGETVSAEEFSFR